MGTRPAIDTLREIRHGDFLEDPDRQLNELNAAVAETRKMGTLTVILKLKPDGSAVLVEDQIKVTEPKLPRSTVFFLTPENNLTARDPRQADIEGLREVDTPQAEAREVDSTEFTAREV